jgi:hypothetical protein
VTFCLQIVSNMSLSQRERKNPSGKLRRGIFYWRLLWLPAHGAVAKCSFGDCIVMKTNLCVSTLVAVALLAFGSPVRANSIYNFDTLTAGSLSGRDGWLATAGGYNVTADHRVVGSGTTTNVARRFNDANWSLTNTLPSSGSGTLTLLMDVKSATSGFSQFGLGYDTNGNGTIELANAENGVLFGLGDSTGNSTCFYVQGPGGVASNNATTISSVLGSNYTAGDWLQLKLALNVSSANVVTGTLYARDLDKSITTWTAALQDYAFGTFSHSRDWNAMYLRFYGAVAIADNLTVGEPSTAPEPSAIVLIGSGLLGLLAYAWRKRRR